MTYTITEACIACAACEPECEEGAIFARGDIFAVDYAKCCDCGICAEICPVEACLPLEAGKGREHPFGGESIKN